MTNIKYKFGYLSGLKLSKRYGGGTIPAKEVRLVVLQAMVEVERICNVSFERHRGKWPTVIRVRRHTGRRGIVPRGWYKKGTNRELGLNSYVLGNKDKNKWTGKNQIRKIVRHEIGHWLGMKHSNDKTSVMHINANRKWNKSDKKWLRRKFGPSNYKRKKG